MMQSWLLAAIFAVVAVGIFLPQVGLLAALRKRTAARNRERVEDALKHLLDRQQQRRSASPESLGGSLNISRQRASELIQDMEAQGLLQSRGPTLELSSDGEQWALHVVRAHRLWEKFLADEARMPLTKVHDEANRREHASTAGELDRMDAAMGHPRLDPHGDPIPMRAGPRTSADAIPLTAWRIGEPAVIAHLEDEPAMAYAQIVAAGIRLGQTVRLLERTPKRLVLSDGEQEFQLAPVVASNIHVTGLSHTEQLRRTAVPLTEIGLGQSAQVVLIDEAVQGFTRRRFMDLGITPGTVMQPELNTFFGDPRGYRVRGTLIALRKEQARAIWVRVSDGGMVTPDTRKAHEAEEVASK